MSMMGENIINGQGLVGMKEILIENIKCGQNQGVVRRQRLLFLLRTRENNEELVGKKRECEHILA